MQDSIFSKGIKRLEEAFRIRPLNEASVKIYYEKLRNIPDAVWEEAIEEIVENERSFPAIATLLKYCGVKEREDGDYAARVALGIEKPKHALGDDRYAHLYIRPDMS